jgi:hypothetical protein
MFGLIEYLIDFVIVCLVILYIHGCETIKATTRFCFISRHLFTFQVQFLPIIKFYYTSMLS